MTIFYKGLVDRTADSGFQMKEVSADKGYEELRLVKKVSLRSLKVVWYFFKKSRDQVTQRLPSAATQT